MVQNSPNSHLAKWVLATDFAVIEVLAANGPRFCMQGASQVEGEASSYGTNGFAVLAVQDRRDLENVRTDRFSGCGTEKQANANVTPIRGIERPVSTAPYGAAKLGPLADRADLGGASDVNRSLTTCERQSRSNSRFAGSGRPYSPRQWSFASASLRNAHQTQRRGALTSRWHTRATSDRQRRDP